jgi:flagellar operon protein (TIGR03826 family)
MNLANCSKCGKVYSPVSVDRTLCPACVKEEQDNFLKVFHFLASQPSATAQQISEGTGVELTEIYRYVRENRLRLVKAESGLRCETCGNPISQGKMCDHCRQKLSAEFKNDVDKFKQNKLKTPQKPPDVRDPKYLKNYRDKGGR